MSRTSQAFSQQQEIFKVQDAKCKGLFILDRWLSGSQYRLLKLGGYCLEVSTACGSRRVLVTAITRPLPQAVLTCTQLPRMNTPSSSQTI